MAWTFCTSGAAISKAGANANSTIIASGAALERWSDEVEDTINGETRYDWTTNYASVGANFQQALGGVASAMIATNIMNYDMSGYTSRQEALTMLNVLDRTARLAMAWLKKKENQEKMI